MNLTVIKDYITEFLIKGKNIKNFNLPDSGKKENKTPGINFEKILSNIKIEAPKNEEKGPTRK